MGQASQRVRADQLFQFDGQLFEVARHISGFVHVAGVVLGEHVARLDIAGERMNTAPWAPMASSPRAAI